MLLLALVLLMALVADATDAPMFIVMGFFVALVLVNIPFALHSSRDVLVRREHATHVKEGSHMTVRLSVTNRSRVPKVLMQFRDRGPAGVAESTVRIPMLAPRSSQSAAYVCAAGRRGVYRFGSCRVVSSFPFGLVQAGRNLRVESELVVYPLYYELAGALFPFLKTYSGMTAAPGARPGEGPSFFGLREYRRGDPIRKIHWPTTVRARTVMVKEFEEDMHSSVTLLLDTDRLGVRPLSGAAATNLETAIRVVATLANYTLANGHPTTLLSFDASSGAVRRDEARSDLTPVLDILARVEPGPGTAADLVRMSGLLDSKAPNGIAVLLSAERAAMASLLKARAGGTEILTVIVDPSGPACIERLPWMAEMLSMFEVAGIHVIIMSPSDDIQTTLSRHLRGPGRMRI